MRLGMSKRYHIAVVGATGAVGVEMFRVLERRGFKANLPQLKQEGNIHFEQYW